jgi:hypothetical protein
MLGSHLHFNGACHSQTLVVVTEFELYVDKSYSWTDLPSKFPTKHVQFPVCESIYQSVIFESNISQTTDC